jgi:acyl-coenzyme A thioesterase PaaI-like protein
MTVPACPQLAPFSVASAVAKEGDGEYRATLDPRWAVGERPHGGYLLAVIARAALDSAAAVAGDAAPDPLAVSAQFLRPPACGPAVIRTAVRRSGRTITVVNAVLEEDGRPCVEATVTCGTLPTGAPSWLDVPDMPAQPPPEAVDVGARPGTAFQLATQCQLRMDPATAGFATGRTDLPPLTRLWTCPVGEPPDALFALVAGDVSPPVVFNLGRIGWAPTVQLTAILRARPAPGWLRVQASTRSVHGRWFDEDHTVVDSAGNLVCQARQLAIAANPPAEGNTRA